MKKLFILLLIVSTNSFAQAEPEWRDPLAKYPASQHKIKKFTLEHRIVKNVQAACDKERSNLGKKPFEFSVDACAVWKHRITGNSCVIITGPMTSQAQLGHELRHCLEGNYHQ
jgi:hypothetical protein